LWWKFSFEKIKFEDDNQHNDEIQIYWLKERTNILLYIYIYIYIYAIIKFKMDTYTWLNIMNFYDYLNIINFFISEKKITKW
jgi:hypothetical protein